MARFQPKTFADYLTRMAQRVVARTELTDLEIGGILHTVLTAVAREFDEVSWQMVNLRDIWDLDRATGADLDARAQDINPAKLSRLAATAAVVGVTFGRSATVGIATIPAGATVRVPGGAAFATTAAVTIADGSALSIEVGATALVAGSAGNVDADTVTQLDAITGVDTVTNPSASSTPGQDRETDAQFRARIKGYLRSLARGTPDALKFAVLDTALSGFGRVVSVEVFELPEPDLGYTVIYADNGAGTIAVTEAVVGEVVLAAASGGEDILFLANAPLVPGVAWVVYLNGVPLSEGAGLDYRLNLPRSQITLSTALSPGDEVTADYVYYTGLIGEAQRIVDGLPANRAAYPGYRAAGTVVSVLPPVVVQQTIEASLVLEAGFVGQEDEIRASVSAALNRYVNGLGVNGDIVYTELIFHAQSVVGLRDVVFRNPTANVIIGSGQLARISSDNIDLS